MTVQRVGKVVSAILFFGAVAAALDVGDGFVKYGVSIVFVILFQLCFSVAVFVLSSKAETPIGRARYQRCCWVGIIYALALGIMMGIRQYHEFGLTTVTPIVATAFVALLASPFIWSIQKLAAQRNLIIK